MGLVMLSSSNTILKHLKKKLQCGVSEQLAGAEPPILRAALRLHLQVMVFPFSSLTRAINRAAQRKRSSITSSSILMATLP